MKILVLPDVQAKPGKDFTFLTRIGTYMVDKKPDVVVCIGDFTGKRYKHVKLGEYAARKLAA